ncbi:MAG: flagellin FliC [Polyangiaceae bacterium]|nr:flagellin FliC [Polyangiaceae bacterium]
MAMSINTNVASLSAQKNLSNNQKRLANSFSRLSSGFRVNTAADDAAGLAVSESMKAQIRSYDVAARNAADGVSMAQTAEGALGEVHSILGRMRELAMQAANGTLSTNDRGYVDLEFSELKDEIARIQGSAEFNGVQVVGATAQTVIFQIGLDNNSNDQIAVTFGGVALTTVLAATTGVANVSSAQASLSRIDNAISAVSGSRASFGAAMNRLDIVGSNIETMRLNLSAANSRIRDVDVAAETSRLSKNQVLSQAGVSVLAQANQLPQLALNLLG